MDEEADGQEGMTYVGDRPLGPLGRMAGGSVSILWPVG